MYINGSSVGSTPTNTSLINTFIQQRISTRIVLVCFFLVYVVAEQWVVCFIKLVTFPIEKYFFLHFVCLCWTLLTVRWEWDNLLYMVYFFFFWVDNIYFIVYLLNPSHAFYCFETIWSPTWRNCLLCGVFRCQHFIFLFG